MSDWNGTKNPSLDARIEGCELLTAPASTKTDFHIVFDFDCDFQGMEFFAFSPNPGDNIDLKTEYKVSANPEIWYRYKKFGKHFNIYPNHVNRVMLFPTKPKTGIRLVISYDNKGPNEVKFSLNKFQFVEMAKVNPQIGEQGEDW